MMFFVMLHYVADAGWSTIVRRPAEQFLATIGPLAVLFVPVLLGMTQIYHWIGADDQLTQVKSPYLNVPFFLARAVVYFVVWLIIGGLFRRASLAQDQSGDPSITLRLRRLSAPGLLAYALTLSFASIDWLMSLDHHWYSTIFGTYVWSGAAVSSLALLSIIVVWLRRGPLRDRLPEDRLHDLGKWVFAFSVFWAYIAFSQYFLIWYANIPEETVWMMHRWTGTDGTASWWTITLLVPICLFVLPFAVLMSANTKRRPIVLVPVCVVVLLGHYLDCYWLVMPTAHEHGPRWGLIWIDVATLAFLVGVLGWFWLRAAEQHAWYPLRDPRLGEALEVSHGLGDESHVSDAVQHPTGPQQPVETVDGR
jgi:hypothetical protein